MKAVREFNIERGVRLIN